MEAALSNVEASGPLLEPQPAAAPLVDRGGTLHAILDSAHEAFVSIDDQGLVEVWSSAAAETFGWFEDEALGKRLSELIIPERYRAAHEHGLRRCLETGDGKILNRRIEIEGLHRDGHELPVELRIFRAVVGGRTVLNAFLQDITQRRAAESEASRLASIVEDSEDAIIAWTLEGTVTSWNPSAERLLGYRADEIVGRPVQRTWLPDSTLQFQEAKAKLADGDRIPTFESGRVRRDGTIVEVSVALSPVKNAAGNVIGVTSILRDITERKQAERALREERTRWQGAFRSAPSGMALVRLDGSWLAVNPSLCRLLGRDEPDLLATDFQSITHPEDLDSDLDQLQRTLGGEITGYELEKRYLLPDGGVVWALLSVCLVRDESGEALYFVSQLQDITEPREAEDELLRYAEHLNELALKDPLTGLRNYRDFHALLDTELQRSRRYDSEWSVVLMDVDHFRDINAGGGHAEGDRVLREVGVAIEEACRTSDHAARIGSDEFALVLPATSADDAARTAKRISETVAARTGGVSMSWGVGSWPIDGESKGLVLLRADMQLQAARSHADAARLPIEGPAARQPDDATDGVRRILRLAREQLGMDVTYMAELTDESQVFRAIDGDAGSFGVAEGAELPLESTYCMRMLDGRIAKDVPDTAAVPELGALPITAEAGVGSYIGVPLKLSDGSVYGTLCGVSHSPTPELSERHVELMGFLAGLIAEQTEHDQQEADLRRSHAELSGINALLSALVARDYYTGEHSKTVVRFARMIALRLGLAEAQVAEVEQVALLHDIGKVGIPDSVLQKRGPLNKREWQLMRQHPAIGARILAGTETLSHLAPAVKAEHERYDGGGYPDGLRGDHIPLASRIAFACDAYHAITSDRPYRAALSPAKARAELQAGAGSQFDPAVVDALLAVLEGDPELEGDAADSQPATLVAEGTAGEPAAAVLASPFPRQTPVWEPQGAPGFPAALGKVRAVCRRCGTHAAAVVTQAAMSGTCGNCGGYELDLLEA